MIETVDMPEDLVVEIFSRVPVASLARFRSISKGCNTLISKDERLAKKHAAHAPRASSHVIMLINYRAYSARLDLTGGTHSNLVVKEKGRFGLRDPLSKYTKQVDICRLFHCEGLLLCTTIDNRLAFWNPVTGQIKWISPGVSFRYFKFCVLGKCSTCNRYKILKIHGFRFGGDTLPVAVEYEIYDLISNTWRSCRETTDWFIERKMLDRGVSLEGNTYWLARKENVVGHVENVLVCFDFSTERFRRASFPVGDVRSYRDLALSVDREGKHLCMSKRWKECDIDVWVATEIGATTSWSHLISVAARAKSLLLLMEQSGSVWRWRWVLPKDILNIVGEDTFIKLDGKPKCSLVVNYLPSLVQIQGGYLTLEEDQSLYKKRTNPRERFLDID